MITVLVPVLNRPHKAQVIADSIESATVTDHIIHFLCSKGDKEQIAACKATGQKVSIMEWAAGRADFAKKINWGAEHANTPFVQVGADDLVFHKGWDTVALEMAEATGNGVIGTNDLHNPRVKRGQSSTHPFVRIAYLKRWLSGTYDQSGFLFSEAYDHQYVDDEFAQTAQVRREWSFARDSVVEHLHPYFRGAPMDLTYEKALRESLADYKLFTTRMRFMRRAVARQRLLMNKKGRM